MFALVETGKELLYIYIIQSNSLSIFGKVQVNPHTQLVLVQALEKYGFGTRTNEQETTEYEVVDIQLYQ